MTNVNQDKVLLGLECCKRGRQNVKRDRCYECPYKDESIMNAYTVFQSCTNVLASEALCLLKDLLRERAEHAE